MPVAYESGAILPDEPMPVIIWLDEPTPILVAATVARPGETVEIDVGAQALPACFKATAWIADMNIQQATDQSMPSAQACKYPDPKCYNCHQ